MNIFLQTVQFFFHSHLDSFSLTKHITLVVEESFETDDYRKIQDNMCFIHIIIVFIVMSART